MRQRHDSYFYYSKRERNAFFVLLVLTIVAALLPRLMLRFNRTPVFSDVEVSAFRNRVDVSEKKSTHRQSGYRSMWRDSTASTALEKFYFDPNLASEDEFGRLGFSARLIRTVVNYRNKGGKFRSPDDLDKIWGMPPSLSAELKPYVRIVSIEPEHQQILTHFQTHANGQREMIDVNTADSLDFLSLPGIGPKLSSRILRFRDRLGGFISVDQIAETYGLPDSSFKKIKRFLKIGNTDFIRRININDADFNTLNSHPYISYHLAKLIVSYREQHGLYEHVNDLNHLMIVNDSIFQRIRPYLIAN